MERELTTKGSCPRRIEIRTILGRRLKSPLVATVETAYPGFVAHASGISVFGYGDDPDEAVDVLKQGIENMCRDDEFLGLRETIQRMLILENLASDEERGPRETAGESP